MIFNQTMAKTAPNFIFHENAFFRSKILIIMLTFQASFSTFFVISLLSSYFLESNLFSSGKIFIWPNRCPPKILIFWMLRKINIFCKYKFEILEGIIIVITILPLTLLLLKPFLDSPSLENCYTHDFPQSIYTFFNDCTLNAPIPLYPIF